MITDNRLLDPTFFFLVLVVKMEEEKKRCGKRKEKAELGEILRKSWFHLRLSVRHPSRVPTWDAIILTAASPQQALLYEWQLARAKRLARIAHSTITLVVPDPQGCRIGSGAATLNAILALAQHYQLHFDSHVIILISPLFDICFG